jgi:integrase
MRVDLRDRIAAHGPQEPHGRVFRFHQGGDLKHKLTRAKLAYLELPCPVRRPVGWHPPVNRLAWANFHTFRHTFATWMRRAGTDVQGLVATGNWRDARSAARYAHVVPREEWQRVDDLPSVEKTWKAS